MVNIATGSSELLHGPLDTLNKRLTTFAFSRKGNHSVVSIVGCFQLEPAIESFKFVRGTIQVGDKNYTVYDKDALEGLPPNEITNEACIVLLDEKISFCHEGTAVIVGNTTELLSILEKDVYV